MSFLDGALGSVGDTFGTIIDDAEAFYGIGINFRSISYIVPDITVQEVHKDDTAIVDQPVETGTTITDHSFQLPFGLEMTVGFSNSTAQTEGYVQDVYQMFQDLQQARQPFPVTTGKRDYDNMLISSLSTLTDQRSESSLNLIVQMRQIIIVNTTTTGGTSPSATGATDATGTQSPTPGVSGLPDATGNPATTTPTTFAGTAYPAATTATPGFGDYLPGGSLAGGSTGFGK